MNAVSVNKNSVYDVRRNFVWAFIGANTTGKTPTAVKMAENWKKVRPDQKVRGFCPRRGFEHLIKPEDRIKLSDENWAEKLLTQNPPDSGNYIYKNFLLILDDYKMLCKGDETNPFFLDLLQARVEMNMDVILVCHMPMLITPRLSGFLTDYSIFYNKAAVASFAKRIDDYESCQEAAVMINEYVKKFGRGFFDTVNNKPKFPHIHIFPESNVFDCINMEADKIKQLTCISL